MTKVRYSQRCVFCGTENRKRSDHAIYFRCKKCKQVNPGPGMAGAHAQALVVATTAAKKTNDRQKTHPAAVTTVIRAAKPETAAKTTPKPKPAITPKVPVPVADEKPGWAKAIWGS